VTRLKFHDLGGGERGAIVVDMDDCTARYVVDHGDGRPTTIQRMTAPAEPARRWRMIACPCCGRNLGLSEWADGRLRVEPYTEDDQ
jgi:hypothetical protein